MDWGRTEQALKGNVNLHATPWLVFELQHDAEAAELGFPNLASLVSLDLGIAPSQ
jgi:hypothetical protein